MSNQEQFRQRLVGRVVVAVDRDDDGVGLAFADGWNLTIWSSLVVLRRGAKTDASEINFLVGSRLTSFTALEDSERLRFSKDIEIVVILRERDSAHPESMMLRGPDALIVVWND